MLKSDKNEYSYTTVQCHINLKLTSPTRIFNWGLHSWLLVDAS